MNIKRSIGIILVLFFVGSTMSMSFARTFRDAAVDRNAAKKEQVSFFSLFEAMGGKGSMVQWVQDKTPKLANTDYTHFNFIGAHKAGNLILEFLLSNYNEYLLDESTSLSTSSKAVLD